MKDEKYNGWSNYATWRINLEIIDGMQWSADDTTFEDIGFLKEYLKDMVELVVLDGVDGVEQSKLAYDYASAFISDVNYHEIAQAVMANYPNLVTGKNTQDGEPLDDNS